MNIFWEQLLKTSGKLPPGIGNHFSAEIQLSPRFPPAYLQTLSPQETNLLDIIITVIIIINIGIIVFIIVIFIVITDVIVVIINVIQLNCPPLGSKLVGQCRDAKVSLIRKSK